MKVGHRSFEEAVLEERQKRLAMKRGYHYWRERGDTGPPPESHYCSFCAGYFGVPHTGSHPKGGCRMLSRAFASDRQCACIECVVAEQMVRAREERTT